MVSEISCCLANKPKLSSIKQPHLTMLKEWTGHSVDSSAPCCLSPQLEETQITRVWTHSLPRWLPCLGAGSWAGLPLASPTQPSGLSASSMAFRASTSSVPGRQSRNHTARRGLAQRSPGVISTTRLSCGDANLTFPCTVIKYCCH